MKKLKPTKGGRYYKVNGKLVPESEYKAQTSQPKTKGDKK